MTVLERIQGLERMSQLPVEEFTERGGLADQFVSSKEMKNELKATQLRRFFHEVKSIQRQNIRRDIKFEYHQISRMMPLLAYARGRKLIPNDFYELMILCFGGQRCKDNPDFERAAEFLEAIMAYHKYHSADKKEERKEGAQDEI